MRNEWCSTIVINTCIVMQDGRYTVCIIQILNLVPESFTKSRWKSIMTQFCRGGICTDTHRQDLTQIRATEHRGSQVRCFEQFPPNQVGLFQDGCHLQCQLQGSCLQFHPPCCIKSRRPRVRNIRWVPTWQSSRYKSHIHRSDHLD